MEIIFIFLASLAIMFAGLLGVVLPFLPGVPLAWLGFLLFAALTDFQKISSDAVLIFFALTVLTLLLDLALPLLGAKRFKASKQGILGASLGLLFGVMLFNVWGILLGPLLGALIGEIIARKDSTQATRSALGVFVGFLAGVLVKVVLILVMMGYMAVSLF